MRKHGLLFVICGPSGSGKSTLAKRLLSHSLLKTKLARPISYTTRAQRRREVDGKDYFFISPDEFRKILRENKILEHTQNFGYDYGTPRQYIEQALKKRKNLLLCLDIKGAESLINLFGKERVVSIFINPPSLEVAKVRIIKRAPKTEIKEIKRRMNLASYELKEAHRFDYQLVNDNLTETVSKIKEIILCHMSR